MDAIVYDKVGKEAEKIRNTLYGIYPQATITDAAIASFDDGADDIPVKALTVGIEPVQDLHGYDNPWPAGGGKNKIDASNVSVTANLDNFETIVRSIILPAGTYTLSWTLDKNVSATRNRPYYLPPETSSGMVYGEDSLTAGRHSWTFTLEEKKNLQFRWWYHTVSEACTISDFQLELGSTATSYAPYSNICPITGFDSVKVTRTGKNLANIAESIMESSGYNRYFPLKLKQGTYTMSCKNRLSIGGVDSSCRVSISDKNKISLKHLSINYQYSNTYKTFNFTITESESNQMAYLVIEPISDGTTFSEIESMQNMVELGSTATAYEPYQGETYDITIPTEAGTVYGGTLDAASGVLTVDRVINSDLASVNGWFENNTNFVVPLSNKKLGTGNITNIICSKYKSMPASSSAGAYNSSDCLVFEYSAQNWVVFRDTAYSSLADFKVSLAGVQLVYELATPITYTLIPTEIRTLLGLNNVWADTGNIEKLTYRADLGKYIDSHITTAVANVLNA